MFVIDSNKTIHITRGDICSILVSAVDNNGADYTFRSGDIVRLMICKKKAYNDVVLSKSVQVSEDSTTVSIDLTTNDTRIGDVIHKPVDYWYEIELNPETAPQTIIGYDDSGAKIFRLYPEGVKVDV